MFVNETYLLKLDVLLSIMIDALRVIFLTGCVDENIGTDNFAIFGLTLVMLHSALNETLTL
jgi:hypothetical protein